MKMPPTQATMARIDFFVGRCPLTRAFSRVVITSASRTERLHDDERCERERAAAGRGSPAPSMTVPTTQEGRVSRLSSCLPVSPVLPDEPVRLLDLGDAAVLILRAERHEDRAEQRERDAEQDRGIVEDADHVLASHLPARRSTHTTTRH